MNKKSLKLLDQVKNIGYECFSPETRVNKLSENCYEWIFPTYLLTILQTPKTDKIR